MMNGKRFAKRKKSNIACALASVTPGQLLFCFMSVFSLALIIRNSDTAIEYMSRGLRLCATTVIPSLFPFMVISELIVSGKAVNAFSGILGRPMKFLFGISGRAGCAFILGTLCGFPVGTRCAVSLYRSGQITKKELQRVISFANNPSSAFVISAVGVSLFGCRRFGVVLYIITLLSAFLIGILQNILSHLFKKQENGETQAENLSCRDTGKSGITTFTSAITSSATGILNVCAFVIFFSAFIGTLGNVVESLGSDIPQTVRALTFGFFELTSGVSEAARTDPVSLGIYICAFIVGWSGLSVHFQIISLCDNTEISFRSYFASKFFQGILNLLLLGLVIKFLPVQMIFNTESISTGNIFWGSSIVGIIFTVIVIIAFLLKILRKSKNNLA